MKGKFIKKKITWLLIMALLSSGAVGLDVSAQEKAGTEASEPAEGTASGTESSLEEPAWDMEPSPEATPIPEEPGTAKPAPGEDSPSEEAPAAPADGNHDTWPEESFSSGTEVPPEELPGTDTWPGWAQEGDYTIFTDENSDHIEGETAADQEIVSQLQEGRIVALAPVAEEMLAKNEEISLLSQEEAAVYGTAAYTVETGGRVYCDEVWTAANDFTGSGNYTRMSTTYRKITYTDSDGMQRSAPLYCLNASKTGLNSTELKEEAVKTLSNSTIRKLLYFGYGGPGSICGEYDPTCSHIDWSKWQNQYFFTHMALSKVYSGDVGYATASETEHVGINRFITKIKGLTIPSRTAMMLKASNVQDEWITANPCEVDLILFPSRPASMDYLWSTFKDGFQLSNLLIVVDGANANNGITITRDGTESWQFLYWTSAQDYTQRGSGNPRVMPEKGTLTLKNGARFRVVFPKNTTRKQTLFFNMTLRPVSFLLVDGSAQTGDNKFQDFGAYVYQGEKGKVRLNLSPQLTGTLTLKKTDSRDKKPVPNAVYQLYAAEDLYSGKVKKFSKDAKIVSGTTDEKGSIVFTGLLPGKYYVKEIQSPEGYLFDVAAHSASVSAGKNTNLSVKDTPELNGRVIIEKVIAGTTLPLSGAEFLIYPWKEADGAYSGKAIKMVYNPETKTYEYEGLSYTEENKGRFKILETRNPEGYSGSWSTELTLTKQGQTETFSYTVENTPSDVKKAEIVKLDSETGKILPGAEFQILEYDSSDGNYHESTYQILYDEETGRYISEELAVTDTNLGRFLLRETKNPEGYTGTWEEMIDVSKSDQQLQFTVENTPEEKPHGIITVKKTDVYTGEVLTDAGFTVYPWNETSQSYEDTLGKDAQLAFLPDKGIYQSGKLELTDGNLGRFKVVETKLPEGYTGAWEKEVHLTRDGEELILEAENEPEQLPLGEITIIKKIKEEDITWAHGYPVFTFVAEGTDARGICRRYSDYLTFVPEGYEVDDSGYALLQVTLKNIPLGKYQVYEEPVMRYYLADAVSNTKNMEIHKEGTPSYGALPIETAYGIASLEAEQKNASITFINEKSRYDGYSHTDVVKNKIPVKFGN